MSNAIYYGKALFYPYIHFNNNEWLKTAALYYKGLDRIVPENFALRDSDDVKKLIDKEDFVRNINPGHDAENIARDFLKFAVVELADADKRKNLLKKLGAIIPQDKPFSVNMLKMGYELQTELPKLGLAVKKQTAGEEDWYEFEPVTGALYMTCLANHIARKENLPVVADNAIFQPLIRGVQFEEEKATNDIGEILASMVIETVVPENIEHIPIEKIITFRRNHDAERHQFYHEISKLVSDLQEVNSQSALDACLKNKEQSIRIAVENLNRSFLGINITTRQVLMGLTIPAFVPLLGPAYAVAAGIILATDAVRSYVNERRKTRSSNPYSYILSLQKLGSKSFLQQLVDREIIL